MIGRLQQHLASAAMPARLAALARDAAAGAPLSLHIDLGDGERDWLASLPTALPFWYRARPGRREYRLGIGHALQLASGGRHRFAALDNAYAGLRRDWRHDGRALAFTGFAFSASDDGPLANALLAIPAILLESIGGRCSATLSIPAGRRHQAIMEWQQYLAQLPRQATCRPLERLPAQPETLADQAWLARCRRALRAIDDGHLDKLVLARSRHVLARQEIDARGLLAPLLAQQADSVVYAHGNGRQVFLGATPERLVRLHRGRIDADALAGTAWPAAPVLNGAKNRREQSLVVEAILAALVPLSSAPPRVAATDERAAGQLRHLRSRISATARPGTTLFDLIAALHPTPAVGGHPAAVALDWLADQGEKRYAWYSGGFGWLDQDGDGDISVALRSALLNGHRALLQAGAGIVAGSDPAAELAETEAKLGTLLAAFAAAARPLAESTGT